MGQLCSSPKANAVSSGGDGAAAEAAAPEFASSCLIPTTPAPFKLVSRREYNHDSTIYEFGLPEGKSLSLPTCACILAIAPGIGADGADVVRPYTPMSDNSLLGKFQLLVKRYPSPRDGVPPGLMSNHLFGLAVGDEVLFKHITFNVKIQYPFVAFKSVSMVCAGTGITPMFQALQRLLDTPGDTTKIAMLYGNKTVEDILLRDELEAYAKKHEDRFRLVMVVGQGKDDEGPPGWHEAGNDSGWIDEEKVAKYCHPPADDTCVFVCGVPPMYNALCGPRDQKEIKEGSTLHKLGYANGSCFKF
jgi:cytochrome-b5 reductase